MKRTLADTIITINDQHSYHIEFQMTKDGDIILRLFEYGFRYALSSHGRSDTLVFPEPMVVYLYDRENFPDEYRIHIQFGKREPFVYSVPVFKYLEKSLEELEKEGVNQMAEEALILDVDILEYKIKTLEEQAPLLKYHGKWAKLEDTDFHSKDY